MPAPTNLNDIDLELGDVSPRENLVNTATMDDIENGQDDIEDFELNII